LNNVNAVILPFWIDVSIFPVSGLIKRLGSFVWFTM